MRYIKLTRVGFRAHVKIASRIVSFWRPYCHADFLPGFSPLLFYSDESSRTHISGHRTYREPRRSSMPVSTATDYSDRQTNRPAHQLYLVSTPVFENTYLRFFQISKNATFYVFYMTCQKVVSKSLVLNHLKWVHILRSVITVIFISVYR